MKNHAASACRQVRRFLHVDEAVSALEYAILVGVVAVAIGTALIAFSGNIETAIETIGTQVTGTTATLEKGDLSSAND